MLVGNTGILSVSSLTLEKANDLELIQGGIAYTKEVAITGEIVLLVPTWLAS
jgi:hypothetical protein